jgi:hypothetical protein
MTITLKAPHNCAGATVNGVGYVVDEQGFVDVQDHTAAVELIGSHGFAVQDRPASAPTPPAPAPMPPLPQMPPFPPVVQQAAADVKVPKAAK